MRAVVQSTYGGPQVLTVAEVPEPPVGPRDVLVAVHAVAVTQGDRRLRSGDFPGITFVPGRLMMGITGPRTRVPGTVLAGRIVAVGAAVTRYAVGDDVMASVMSGGAAERVVIREDGPLARMPAGWTHEEAADLPYGALTAMVALTEQAGEGAPAAGKRVAVVGAAGGVGRYAVQLAGHLGADVTGLCGDADGERVRGWGAARTLDPRRVAFPTAGDRFDLVFDTVGGLDFARVRSALTPTGAYVSLLLTVAILVRGLVAQVFGGPRAVAGVALPDAARLDAVRVLAEAGAFQPSVAASFPLDRVADAHAAVEAGGRDGAVVVRIASAEARLVAVGG